MPNNNTSHETNKVFTSAKKIEERETRTQLVNSKNQNSGFLNLDSTIAEWRESEIRLYRKDPLKDTYLPAKVVFLIHPRGKYNHPVYLREVYNIRHLLSPVIKGEKGKVVKDEDGKPIKNSWIEIDQVPTTTSESDRMSKELKCRGFKFVGSTRCYAFVLAVGMVNDHVTDCFRYEAISNNT